ncbi:serine O-acetyltransferase [Methylibium sp.]|uniref:serine O-acetyltransferase n=1 Tax=Methylibium sp. TaxID=2067992 RepID=UPI003D0BDB9C
MKREDLAVLAPAAPAKTPPAPERRPGIWRTLREDVACVVERDPAARSRFEVWTLYPGVHAVAAHRVAHALWQHGWRYLPRLLSFLARAATGVDIHPGACIGRRFFIDHGAGVVIGETAEIGDDATLYHGVTLGGTSGRAGKRHPTLGDGVVVGAGAKVLGPITIGDRARVAANSVVIDEVPAGATVVGIPGRVVVPRHQRSAPHGIDLAHHLVPDPVGKAIGCLLDRIANLEREMVALRGAPSQIEGTPCHDCDDSCAQPVFGETTP